MMMRSELDAICNKTPDFGNEMYDLIKELFPICRSITGNGVRKSLELIQKHIDLRITEVPSGTKVFDWSIPKEWNITDAYIIDPKGKKIVDFKNSNLHVLNYSIPINKKISLEELKPHLHSIPEQPDLIPYRTSYYKEEWGFCLSHKQFSQLDEGEYQVVIDSSLKDGTLTYGEYYIKGTNDEEIVISCYVCHPSMCNDNLSGVVLTTFLAKIMTSIKTRYSYRFLFIPETIGAITWLSINEKNLYKIKHGLVATCLGDNGNFTYKKSRKGDNEIDKAAQNILKFSTSSYKIENFYPFGSDERQFCSPGFNLPFGSLMRTPYGQFPEYHTSADNLDFVKPKNLADTLVTYLSILYSLENNGVFLNLNPKCEPQLSKRMLYNTVGGSNNSESNLGLLWVLNLSDGKNTLLDISNISNIPFQQIRAFAEILGKEGLISEIDSK